MANPCGFHAAHLDVQRQPHLRDFSKWTIRGEVRRGELIKTSEKNVKSLNFQFESWVLKYAENTGKNNIWNAGVCDQPAIVLDCDPITRQSDSGCQ